MLADQFSEVQDVLLTGSSAGGFGSAVNYVPVAEAFAPTVVNSVSDALPPFRDDAVLAPCLERLMVDVWDVAMPPECSDCPSDREGFFGLASFITDRYPSARFGMVSTTRDEILRSPLGFGFGTDMCGPVPSTIDGETFENALLELRTLEPLDRWATFFAPGVGHGLFLTDDAFTTSVDGTTVQDWLREFLAGNLLDVGP